MAGSADPRNLKGLSNRNGVVKIATRFVGRIMMRFSVLAAGAALVLGMCLTAPGAAARTAKARHLAARPALCAKPVELALPGNRLSVSGSVAAGQAACFAFTAPPGAHLTLTIDSPSGAAVFRLYQLKWYQLPARHGAKAKWIEIVSAPDGEAGQTWSGAVPGKSRHALVVKSLNGPTDFRLAVGVDPLHPEI
jgi:hypothetical protein